MRGLRLLLVSALAAAGLTVATAPPAAAADATVAGFQQCANGTGTALTCAGGWINGSMQSGNSHFREDDVVPQRVVINLPADNALHTLTFTFQDRKGSVHAYDSLGTWNTTVEDADPCGGIAATLCAGTPTSLQMATDGATIPPVGPGISPLVSAHDLPDADRQWTMYGGLLVSDSVGPHTSPVSGDDLVNVSVSFRNPTPATARQAVLLFGGHLAVGGPDEHPRAWGQGLGASSVSGGPYAFKLEKIDGRNSGATANSIQASATQPLPPAAFTITKTASTADATPGQSVDYTITVENTGGTAGSTTFTDDHDDAITPGPVTPDPGTGGSCVPSSPSGNDVLSCTTMLIPAGGQQVFTYSAAMPETFTGTPATGCDPGEYPVRNTATLAGGAGSASATVCVAASAQFAIEKTSPATTVGTGDTVEYTVTVTNTGDASGSTSFTDDFDDRLAPSAAVSAPAGNDCAPTTSGDKVFDCTTAVLAPGASQSFTYTAVMPDEFDGGAGEDGCGPAAYPVVNTATLTGGASDSVTLCVDAAPTFSVTKSADDTTADPGQEITYTITVENTGDAAGSTTFTDDFDDRLAPSTAVSAPVGADCPPTTDDGNELFDCATGTIPAGGAQTFTYTAGMPESFSGPSGGGACEPGSYPLRNTVTLANDATSGVTVCVGAAANFTVTKSVDDATPAPGQTVRYTITVENIGDAAGSTTFTDDHDDRMDVTVPEGCEPGSEAGTFTCSTGEVGAGESVTFTYDAVVPSTFGPTSGGGDCSAGSYPIANTATLADGPSSTVELCVAAAPSYTVVKSISDETPEPGQTVTYTIRVRNTGTAAGATGFVDDFDDRLAPTGISSTPATGDCSVVGEDETLSCSTGVIPAGAFQDFTYTVTLPLTYDGGAGADGCGPDTYRIDNAVELAGGAADSVAVCVPAAPSFIVSKSVDNEAPQPGDTVNYTITVTNNGNASGSTSFTDDFDDRLAVGTAVSDPVGDDCTAAGGAFSCTTGTIQALDQQTFTYSATIPATFSGDGGGGACEPGTYRIHNEVELAGGGQDAVTLCVAAAPDFDVEKTVETDGEVGPGDTVGYTLIVTNNGDAAGSTTIVDDFGDRLDPTVPDGCVKAGGKLTCTTGTIAAGDSETFTYDATLPSTFTGGSGTGSCEPGEFQVANSVTVPGTSAADSVDVCVPASPDFEVAKAADDTTVGAGDPVTYTITVTNTGTAPGSTDVVDDYDDRLDPSVAVSDPAGRDCVPVDGAFSCSTASLDPGESQAFTYTVAMPATFADGAATGDCAPGRFEVVNSVQAGDSGAAVTVCVAAAPAFEVAKTASRDVALPGEDVVYEVTVTNTGTAAGSTTVTDVSGATIADPPAGCELVSAHELGCTTGTLAAGESVSFTYTATLPATYTGSPDSEACDPPAYPVRNVATLLNGDIARTVVCVGAAPDFAIEKTVADATLDPGDDAVYTVEVTNTGSAPGSTSFTDTPDSRYDLTGVVAPDGCTSTDGTFVCATATLQAGEAQSFTFTLPSPTAYTGEPGGGTCDPDRYLLTNTAVLDDGVASAADVCVAAAPAFTVAKSADDRTVGAGDPVAYTITVTNTGTAAGATSLEDDHDDRITPGPVAISGAGGSCSDDGDVLTCDTRVLAAGASQTFTYTASMPATFTGEPGGASCGDSRYPVRNDVTVGEASDGVTVCVLAAPDITVAKSASTEVAAPGQVVTYTVTVDNAGTAPAPGSFTDSFANGLAPALVSADGADCEIAPGANGSTLDCTFDLAAGGQASVVYTLTMPASFDGGAGTGDCGETQYPVVNQVSASTRGDTSEDGVTVCVDAEAQFSVEKSAEADDPALPGGTITYRIVVTNNGTASGSTSFVDDHDDRLTPTVPDGCSDTGGALACDTGTILAGASQTFTYTATLPETFGADDGARGCADGTYAVHNAATLADGPADDAVVCVTAAPDFTVAKSVDDATGEPGQRVTYTVTVANGGDAAGSTTFTDDYDDDLTDVTVPDGCTAGAGSFTCDTVVIQAGGEQEFTYSANLPTSYTGDSGSEACEPGTYEVANSVGIEGGDSTGEVVCVTAAPDFTVTKSVDDATVLPGATVTYTITVENVGTASGTTTVSDDYDDRLDPSAPDGCEKVDGVLTCDSGELLAGESTSFVYTAVVPETYTGTPGGGTCADDRYLVANSVEVDGDEAAADVCVSAAPEFVVDKTVDDEVAEPGQTVRYTVTVTNTGDAEGSTTIVDDYDERLDPTVPDGCEKAGGMLTCTTGDLEAGEQQVFEYDAQLPATYRGESGIEPCGPGEFGVANAVRIGDDEVASQTVCVPAAPEFGLAKEISDSTPEPGQEVTYTVTVSNTGSTAGASSFTDDYDDRLDPTVPDGCSKAGGVLTCETDSIEPGDEQVFSYTATIPGSFTGTSGGNGCDTGTFPITNGVVEAEGATDDITVCIAARPDVVLTKSSTVDVRSNGDQVLTYTLTWTNHGAAEALGAVLTDALPSGTGFVSCTGGCSIGGSPSTATWQVGSIAPRGGTSSVVLVVKVTNNELCTVPNQAKMRFDNAAGISSNPVTDFVSPQPDPANARSSGDAVGLEVKASGLLTLVTGLLTAIIKDKVTAQFSHAASSQAGLGGPATDSDEVIGVKLPANGSILSAGVLTTTSNSSVSAAPAETRQTTTSEVAGVCLVPVAGICTVETGTVRAVASTTANGGYATASSTGSTIQSLKVLGLDTPVNLNQTTTIPLNAAVFGKNSYVAINERSTSSGFKNGKYVADASVTMIHVKITGVLLGLQAVEIKVAQATAHSEFPKTPLCANQPDRSVSGHAYAARLGTNVLVADLTQGYVQISPLGGSESEQVAGAALPGNGSIVGAKVADTSSTGSLTTSSATSRSWAEVAGDGTGPVCVLRTSPTSCVVSATAVRSEARSAAGPGGSTSTDTGTALVDLRVLGLPVALTPAPNTTINLPGIGFIILNEQFCDAGGAANHSCAGAPASGLTVRAVRIVVTVANNLLGLTPGVEVVVAEAHADSSFG